MKNIINRASVTSLMFVFAVLTLVAAPIAAHAADLGEDYGYSFSSPTDYGSSYSAPVDYGTSYSSPTDYGTSYSSPTDYGYSYSSPQDYGYSYGTPTGYDSYGTPSYSPSGYSTSGYSTGGYTTGGGYNYSTPVYRAPTPVYTTPSYGAPSNTNINTNTNTCLNNSCNNDDHSVVNITNPAPVINNVIANYGQTQTQTQYCAAGYYGTYPNCYINNNYQQPIVYQPHIAYAQTPYVSLSQVPYTGLDLGFWGTIAYWSFMVGFALVVAYLIAIKRVQNSIALKLKHFLLGTDEVEEEAVVVTTHSHSAVPAMAQVEYIAAAQSSEDVIDSFIMSQISRPRRA